MEVNRAHAVMTQIALIKAIQNQSLKPTSDIVDNPAHTEYGETEHTQLPQQNLQY